MTPIRSVLLFAFFALVSGAPAFAQSNPSDSDLAQMLRAGGHVIVTRHGATNEDQADTDPHNTDNIAEQRQLNAKGENAARALGAAVKFQWQR